METNIRTKQLNFCLYRGYLSAVRLQFSYFQKKVGLFSDFLMKKTIAPEYWEFQVSQNAPFKPFA